MKHRAQKTKRVGWLALGIRSGRMEHLWRRDAGDERIGARGMLLRRLGVKSARKMYRDHSDGSVTHTGYVCGGDWWTIYEVHTWRGTCR